MRAAFQIALKDLRLRIRDRSAVIIGVIAPLVLAFIFNLVFGGAFTPSEGLDISYGIVDEDRGDITVAFSEGFAQSGQFEVGGYNSRADAEQAIEDGTIDAFFHFEPGFTQEVLAGGSPQIAVVGDVDSPTSTQIAASIAEGFSISLRTSTLALTTAAALSGSLITPDFIASVSDPTTALGSFSIADLSADTKQLDPTTYFAAGMAAFFLFFTVQYGVLGLLEEERDGTMARLLAAPISRSAVVSGKAILSFLLGLIATTILIVSTALLMGAEWGHPLGVALLAIAGVLSAVGIMGFVAALAKSPEGAGNLGAIIAVILGMLGGVFFPIGQGDDFLSNLTFITPHAWFMRGLAQLSGDASWTEALPAVGAIMLFAVVTGGAAWTMLSRRMRT